MTHTTCMSWIHTKINNMDKQKSSTDHSTQKTLANEQYPFRDPTNFHLTNTKTRQLIYMADQEQKFRRWWSDLTLRSRCRTGSRIRSRSFLRSTTSFFQRSTRIDRTAGTDRTTHEHSLWKSEYHLQHLNHTQGGGRRGLLLIEREGGHPPYTWHASGDLPWTNRRFGEGGEVTSCGGEWVYGFAPHWLSDSSGLNRPSVARGQPNAYAWRDHVWSASLASGLWPLVHSENWEGCVRVCLLSCWEFVYIFLN